jgi:glyoxylase-like metal-dependent hydrolase (beta-lactamase superfamily II)
LGKNGVVVVDTPISGAKKVLTEVENIKKPILGIIYTHHHPDHVMKQLHY